MAVWPDHHSGRPETIKVWDARVRGFGDCRRAKGQTWAWPMGSRLRRFWKDLNQLSKREEAGGADFQEDSGGRRRGVSPNKKNAW